MAEGVVQLPPDSTGKSIRTMTGGASQPASTHQEVHTLALGDGTIVPGDAGGLMVQAGATSKKFDAVLTAKATYTTSGDHTLITPPGGQSLRVLWFYAQAKGLLDVGTVLVTFTLGTKSYEFELTGSQIFAHAVVWDGAANQTLVVNTSNTAAILINVDYRSF